MSILRVHDGFLGMTLQRALEKASPGSTIALAPGVYSEFETIPIGNLRIIGTGASPGDVVLRTQLSVHENLIVENLTVEAPPFHNAINLSHPSGACTAIDVELKAEPTGQYPALYVDGASVTLKRSTVRGYSDGAAALVKGSGSLVGVEAAFEVLQVSGAQVTLEDSTLLGCLLQSEAKLTARGVLTLNAPEGQWAMVLTDRAVAALDVLATGRKEAAVHLTGSVLTVTAIQQRPEDGSWTVRTRGRSHVGAPQGAVTVVDEDRLDAERKAAEARRARAEAERRAAAERARVEAEQKAAAERARVEAERRAEAERQAELRHQEEARRREEERKPRQVLWLAENAQDFCTVADELRPGDTVVLEHGDYHLPHGGHMVRCNIRGAGERERIRLHGSLHIPEKTALAITNVMLLGPADNNTVNVHAGGEATLQDVSVVMRGEERFPPLISTGGRLSITDVVAVCEREPLTPSLAVINSGEVQVSRSTLGFVVAEANSRALLTDVSVQQLNAHSGAEVAAVGTLSIRPNSHGQRGLVSQADSRLTLATVQVEHACEFYVRGELDIARLEADPHPVELWAEEQARYRIYGDPPEVVLCRDGKRLQEQQTAHQHAEGPPAADADGAEGEELPEQRTPPTSATPEAPHSTEQAGDEPPPVHDPLAELDDMIGLHGVKGQVETFIAEVRLAEARRQQGLNPRRQTLHSQFLGNPGTGKTTVARILGRALHQAGVLRSDVFVEVGREDLVSEHIGGTAPQTRKMLESALGGVLFVDEAYTLASGGAQDFGREAITTLLTFMENHRDDIMVILAGYPEQMHDFFATNPGLRSRVPLRFDFEDYTPDELTEIGLQALEAEGLQVDEDAYGRTIREAHSMASDRSNGRWVRNLNDKLVRNMARRLMASGAFSTPGDVDQASLSQVTKADLYALLGRDPDAHSGVEDILAELDALVGLAPVKDWVRSLVSQAQADARLREDGVEVPRPTYHMVFAGNPGTGKTTVARLVGKLFHRLNILSTPQVVEADRSRMVGQYIGQTEHRTSLLLDEARGGVLFVDEAYQLDIPESANDFGKAAVETLLTRLEEDRHSFIAIFAGYTNRMERFLQLNPGLASRVPLRIEFPDYSPEEIAEIVVRTLQRTWTFDDGLVRTAVSAAYASVPPTDRSNARWARNTSDALSAAHRRWIAEDAGEGDDVLRIRDEVVTGVLAQP